MNSQLWHRPAVIADNHFVNKSLSCWSYNIAVGCAHACRFCYVPNVSTIKLGKPLAERGVKDPDAEWGDYVMARPWDAHAFRASLLRAERRTNLNADGNRAVMLCTTTDPYQTAKNDLFATVNKAMAASVTNGLEMILAESTLNVRILTRSPLARRDFELFRKFGHRLLFGMSLPTLDNYMARVYEPNAPAPSQRLATLQKAKEMGIPIYVAVAPTYPEMTQNHLYDVMKAVAALQPVTIFHEPINIRAENVARIAKHAAELGFKIREDVWRDKKAWADYNVKQLRTVEACAEMLGVKDRLHLWPDNELGRLRPELRAWFESYWRRISEWPAAPK